MNTRHALLAMPFAIIAIAACKKDKTPESSGPTLPPPSGQTALGQLFDNNIAAATQSYSVPAAAGGQIIGDDGTRLLFEPNAFVHPDGSPVTGAVDVKLVEALGIGDMIWLNKQTVGNDNGTLRMLNSGGAINVYATQGGNEVQVRPGGLVASIPTSSPDPAMQLFRGTENADGTMIWDPIDSASVVVDPGYYTAPNYVFPFIFYYNLNPAGLNWINCDYFYNYPNITPLQASIPAGQSPDSTQVWVAFPSVNSVTGMYYGGGQLYWTGGGYEVPVGMSAVIVGLQLTATGYASSFTNITITSNMTVPITFSPTTLEQFQADVDAL